MVNSLKIVGAIILTCLFFTFLDRVPTIRPMQLNAASMRKGDGAVTGAIADIKHKIESLGASRGDSLEISDAILTATAVTGVDSDFITALMYTESRFNKRAVSPAPPRGYHGLMQIPYPVFDAHANTIIGANIFNEKLKHADGNVTAALCLYKGFGAIGGAGNKEGLKQSRMVLSLYNKLKTGGRYAGKND